MRRFRCLLLALLLSAGGLSSPRALAAYCSNIFPGDETPTGSTVGAVLDLSIMDTKTYTGFPSNGEAYTAAGDHFYRDPNTGNGPAYSSKLNTKKVISVPPGQPVRIFVDGDLDLGSDSEINSNGYAGDLILIVRGNLSVGTKNMINALIYVTGNIISNPDTRVNGALTAQGTIDTGKQGVTVIYDPNAAQDFAFGDICDPTVPSVVHHYLLSYAPQALTCQPHSISVIACSDAACSSGVEAVGSLVAQLQGGSDVASVGFATDAAGSGTASLPIRTAGKMTLRVDGASTQCSVAGCALAVADAGFIVDVPPLLAGKPASGSIQAVRSDNATQQCVPAFDTGTRTLLFTSAYSNPASGSLAPLVNGQVVTTATPVDVTFGAQARAPLQVRYDDAGQMTLAALYAPTTGPESGLLMSGATTYVSRPYGLHLSSDADCTSADIAGCPVLRAAGDSFPLRIRAVAWEFDGELRTAAELANNPGTPNFQLANITLSSTVAAPAGGDDGSLSPASYDHLLGAQTSADISHSEVGIFRITATPQADGYFGYTVSGGESGLIGRFTPAYLQAGASAQLAPACGTFSYQQQEIGFAGGLGPLLTVTGYNRQGAVTNNYDRGEFWRLDAPQRQGYLSVTGRTTLDALGRLETLGNPQSTTLASDWTGDGARQFRWADDRLRWTAALQPQNDDLPFPGVAGTAIARLSLLAAQLRDADGICYGSAGCSDFDFDFGGSEVRLGRLRFGNAFGSELQGLDVPFWLESWQDLGGGMNGFRSEGSDSCSAPLLGSAALYPIAGAGVLQPSDFTAPTLLAPVAGQGAVRLPAPGKEGSVSVGLVGLDLVDSATLEVALPWLFHDWNGDGVREAARGLATFGIYRGSAPLIFRREVYR